MACVNGGTTGPCFTGPWILLPLQYGTQPLEASSTHSSPKPGPGFHRGRHEGLSTSRAVMLVGANPLSAASSSLPLYTNRAAVIMAADSLLLAASVRMSHHCWIFRQFL
jgi:hypothetical protein